MNRDEFDYVDDVEIEAADLRKALEEQRAYEGRKDKIARALHGARNIAEFPDALLFAAARPDDRGRLVLCFPPGNDETHEFFDRLDAKDRVVIGFGLRYHDLQARDERDLRAIAAAEGRPLTKTLFPTLDLEGGVALGDEEESAARDFRASRLERIQLRAVSEQPALAARSFQKVHLAHVLAWCQGRCEHYLAQNAFRGYRRVTEGLHQATALFVDLDHHSLASRAIHKIMQDDHDAVDLILSTCAQSGPLDFAGFLLPGIPAPTQIIRSGRGIYCKWIFDHFLPSYALSAWKLCQAAIHERFKSLGADPRAMDAARILRVVGSTNSNADGTTVRILVTSPRQSFGTMAAVLLPQRQLSEQERQDVRALAKACCKADRTNARLTRVSPRHITVSCLTATTTTTQTKSEFGGWPAFVVGLRKLIRIRMNDAGTCEGHRELFVFWLCTLKVQLGRIVNEQGYWKEAEKIASSVGSKLEDVRPHLRVPRSIGGQAKPYSISKSRLIEVFSITRQERDRIEEFRADVVRRSPVKRPRKDGPTPAQALELAHRGWSRARIATHLAVSGRTLRLWFAEFRLQDEGV